MKFWQPGSLPAWQKYLNVKVILISEFMNPEIRLLLYLGLLARISFRKTSIMLEALRPWNEEKLGWKFAKQFPFENGFVDDESKKNVLSLLLK